MADVWHYRMDGTVLGPVHFADLQGLAAIGRLQPTHEVRRHQDAHWQRVQDVAGLLPGGAAPLSDNTADDASEHDLDAMLSGPSAGMLEPVDVSDHDLEGLLAGAESTDTDDDLTSDLDAMLATNAGGDVGIGRASRQAGANRWYYRHLGQMLGPVDLDGLMDLCAAGKLTPADEIRLTHSSDWERADSIVGLFAYQPSPAHQPSTAIDDADEPAEWYYRREGENLGPVTFSALLQLVAEGVLAPADEIRQGKLGGWMEAVSMVGLFSRDQLIAAGYIAAPEEMAEAEPLATVLPELPPPPPRPPREKNDAPKGKRKGKDKGRRPEKSQHDAAMEDWAASVLSEPSQEEERPRRSTTPAAARATTTSKPTTETEETSAVAAETSAFDVAPTPATAAPSPFAAAARTTSPPPPPPPSKAAKAPKKLRSGPSISIPAGMGPILVKVGAQSARWRSSRVCGCWCSED